MQYGLFTMPSHPPERGLYDGHRWDLDTLRWADAAAFRQHECSGADAEYITRNTAAVRSA